MVLTKNIKRKTNMKKTLFLVLLCLLATAAHAQRGKRKKKGEAAATVPAPPPSPMLKTYMDSVSYAVGTNIGQSVNSQQMDSVNVDMLVLGLRHTVNKDTSKANAPLLDEMQAMMLLQKYFGKLREQQEAKSRQLGEANKKVADDFLAANKTKPGVVTTGTGLQYVVMKEGTGPYPKPTDRVKVHYVGTFMDGKKFDSSIDRGQPATFGLNQVIKGWTEALQMMKVGSKWRIFLPPDLAYGSEGRGDQMPPNSLLIFEVELLGIEK